MEDMPKMERKECTVEMLFEASKSLNIRGYRNLMKIYREKTGIENLDLPDKKIVSAATAMLREVDAAQDRDKLEDNGIAIFTAYTSDYSVGYSCEQVNRMYAEKHGYEFHSDILSYSDMMAEIAPRQFCGWYKVAMIRRFLSDFQALKSRQIGYLMWIDADAVVINHEFTVKPLLERAGHRGTVLKYRNLLKSPNLDLIIAEDVNPCCLINTGVVLIRVSEWSRDLWEDVWNQRRYFDVTFYEQSALMRCLKKRLEGLDSIQPFHSYVSGGRSADKLFPHTCVVPHLDLNSNRCRGLTVHVSNDHRTIDTGRSKAEELDMARYIFHCAGTFTSLRATSHIFMQGRCNKALTLQAVLDAHGFVDVRPLGSDND